VDEIRFDAIARSLSQFPTRRGALRAIVSGLLVAGGIDRLGLATTSAKKKKTKKTCPRCRRLMKGKCNRAHKPDGTVCGPGLICQSGNCRRGCPAGQELCAGTCLPLCGTGTARNPSTCACCLTSGQTCPAAPATNTCCSGNCPAGTCVGGLTGTMCRFGAQCASAVCNGGICA
jgi:hypothetical protein